MNPFAVFKEIEQSEPVERLQVKQFQVWPIIRLKFFEELRAKSGISSRVINVNASVIKTLSRNCTYGFQNLLNIRKKKYWIFSSSDRRKERDGQFLDRVTEGIPSVCQDSIVIENPFPLGRHYPIKQVPNPEVTSQAFFYLGSFLISLFFRKISIKDEDLLKRILKKYDLHLDYRSAVATFLGQYYLTTFLLKFCKVKMVFMVYTASSMGYIRAFRRKGIPVVEMQHGVINGQHVAYNVFKKFESAFFPDYLFTYGNTELTYFHSNNHFIQKERVFPVGYYFLETMAKGQLQTSSYEQQLRSSYRRIVVFSFQEPLADITLPFLRQAAAVCHDILILIVPRTRDYPFNDADFPRNLRVERTLNIYQAMRIADVHVTVTSTTALEAFSFGIPNILIDINHLASDYYKRLFEGLTSVEFVSTPDEFVVAVSDLMSICSEVVKAEGAQFFISGWENNFKRAVAQVENNHNCIHVDS